MSDAVLVVDDDDGVQVTVQSILEDEGYQVVVATDGLDALAELDGFFPALILLDITMPRMNGNASCRGRRLPPQAIYRSRPAGDRRTRAQLS